MAAERPDTAGEPPAMSEKSRSILSLLLFIHLFCIFVALAASARRSAVQNRLLNVLAPYTRLLHFDLDYTPYHLTRGADLDEEHYVQVQLGEGDDAQTVRLAELGGPLEDERRHRTLAYVMAFGAGVQNDFVTSELARSVGTRMMDRYQVDRVEVEVLRRDSQPRNLARLPAGMPRDADDPAYLTGVYEATVWQTSSGVQVLKKSSRGESAPVASPNS